MVVERKNGVQKKVTDRSGLGRAIINRRAKAAKIAADPTLHASEIVHGLGSVTQENDLDEFLSTAQLADTDFTAERQNIKVVSDPTLNAASHNPYLLTPQQERELQSKHRDNEKRLQVPRRPPWTRQMTTVELERTERDSFLEWRRGLADLQDNKSLLLTPFERNLEVWRQLWRTLERSDLVVQIVDARSPLKFRSEDLERYVMELNDAAVAAEEEERRRKEEEGGDEDEEEDETPVALPTNAKGKGKAKVPVKHIHTRKKNLLLINKSDLLTRKQREEWATYFESRGIQYAFFSAANSTALQEERARKLEEEAERARMEAMLGRSEDDESDDEEEEVEEAELSGMKVPKSGNKLREDQREDDDEVEEEDDSEEEEDTDDELAGKMRRGAEISTPGSDESDRTRILSVLELEDLFLSNAPEVSVAQGHTNEKLVVGLVGYPNVGKSSTINALIGEKKVSVSATPGKTKHFQTISLSPDVLLCDCPGLVFPQFAATKADLVCDGVLPIDQMREHTGPIALVTHRIPQEVLEGTYGLKIVTLPISEGGSGVPTASEFLTTYGIARGFFTGGMGNVDESRASRFVLKDYVNGKLLYCHPPPGVSTESFNEENRDLERLRAQGKLRKKQAPTTRVPIKADTYIHQQGEQGAATVKSASRQSSRAQALDRSFFTTANLPARPGVRGVAADMNGGEFSRVKMFGHQGLVRADGTVARRRGKGKGPPVGTDAGVVLGGISSDDKKHFKKRREKKRSGRGYDDM
ncbi:P-loop containing nucleoside triphosphate hydrolase protein [Meredithblackwellia eburnea MCA 4105]